jgi:hypothetical protein
VIHVAVVDDHPHVAIALRALLDKTAGIRLVAESWHGNEVAALMRGADLQDWGEPTAWEKQQRSALVNGELR